MTTPVRLPIVIAETNPFDPDAVALIDLSEAEQVGLYPAELVFTFSPQQLIDTGATFLVARRDGTPVGCGAIAPCDGYGELKRIFTVPEARGTGVAGAMVKALEATARATGLTLLRLETGEDSPDAVALYTKHGYARCGIFGDYPENPHSVFMEKRLG